MNRPYTLLASIAAAGLLTACSSPDRTVAPPARATAATVAPAPAAAAAAVAHSHAPGGAHSDHDPKEGGILYMSGNMYHHIEASYLEPGVFRLYMYDDYTKRIDAQATSGTIRIESAPDVEIPLVYDAATNTLIGRIDPPPALPMVVLLTVDLTEPKTGAKSQEKHRFPFAVAGPVVMPAGGHDHGHDHATGDHPHGSPHGGQVVTSGDYHFELVSTGDMLVLWILDVEEATLPVDGMQATLLLQPATGSPVTLPLPPMGNVHFMAKSPLALGTPAVAVATVTIGGTTHTGRFTIGGTP